VSRAPRQRRPPIAGEWLLEWLAPARMREELAGDLHELFLRRAARDGSAVARRWYWRQVWRAFLDMRPVRRPVVSRRVTGDPLMLTLGQDVRYALRMFGKHPGFTAVAVLMLAIGIGANATIFSWVNSALLNPLPGTTDSGRLVQPVVVVRGDMFASFSYPDFRDIRDEARTLAGVAARDDLAVGLVIDHEAERAWAELATGNFFDVLGVSPWRGRLLNASDDARGAEPVLVLSHDYWVSRFGAADAVVGRQVRINQQPFTIVGVAPPGFQGGESGLRFDVWVPMGQQPNVMAGGDRLEIRQSRWLSLLARLAPDATIETARAEVSAIARRLSERNPQVEPRDATLVPLSESPTGGVSVLRPVLLVLMSVAVIVLLIACANLAGLLLARAAARQREMAIRLSIGAGRSRLIQQLLVEGGLLALAGGVAALVALRWTGGLLMLFAPPSELPIHLHVAIDGRVVAFTAAIAVATVLLFALVPAFQSTTSGLARSLRDGGSAGRVFSRHRLRRGLVAAQVALSITLLVAAGLCVRSLWAARLATPGFTAEGIVVGWLDLFAASYAPEAGRAFYSRVLDRVGALPGVQSVTLARRIPLGFSGGSSSDATIDGYQPPDGQLPIIALTNVGPDYFATMRIPLVAGRDVSRADEVRTPRVAVVSETMARRFWPGGNAVGGRFMFGGPRPDREPAWITVVGVARDIKHRSMTERPQPVAFLPVLQAYQSSVVLHVRTAGDTAALAADLPRVLRELDPSVPFYSVGLLADHTAAATFTQRLAANLLVVFGGLALLLAAVGSYGVLSFLVGQRRREIGIRLAIGASRGSVFRQVASSGARLVVAGAVAGFALAVAAGFALRSLLIGVEPVDPITYAVVGAILTAVALAACALPARRAALVDPMTALRED
jgi:predicted permease